MKRFVIPVCGVLLCIVVVVAGGGCRNEQRSNHAAALVDSPFVGDHAVQSNAGSYSVGYSVVGRDDVPLNQSFDLHVVVRDATTGNLRRPELAVDAGMPQHGHGMNVQPIVVKQGDGTFLVRGMLFHMPGRWELYFDITRHGITERAQTEINLQ